MDAGNPPCGPVVPTPRSMELHCRFMGARKFLEKASGVRVHASTQAELVRALADGELLCRVALLLHGDKSMAPVTTQLGGLNSAVRVNENFSRFKLACAALHVHTHYIVTKEDVMANRTRKIVNCILELERYAKRMSPPPTYPTPSNGAAPDDAPATPRVIAVTPASPAATTTTAAAAPTVPATPPRPPTANIVTSPLSGVRRSRRTPRAHPSPAPSSTPRAPPSIPRSPSTARVAAMGAAAGAFHMGLLGLVSTAAAGVGTATPSAQGDVVAVSSMQAQAALEANNQEALLAANRAQTKRMSDLRTKHARVAQELQAANQRLADANTRARQLQSAEDHLKVRIKRLESQNQALSKRLEHAKASSKDAAVSWQDAEHTLKQRVKAAEAEAATLRDAAETLELRLKAVQAKQDATLQAVKAQQVTWGDAEARLMTQNKTQYGEIESLRAKLTQEFNAKTEANRKVASLEAELQASKDADAAMQRRIAAMQQDVAAANARATAAAARTETQVSNATAELQARVAALEKQVSDATASAAAERMARAAEQREAAAATAKLQKQLEAFKSSKQLLARLGKYCRGVKAATASVRGGLSDLAQDVRDSVATTATDFGRLGESLVGAVSQAVEQRNRALRDFQKETAERRRVFNLLQEARGNIRVYARVRPLLGHEIGREEVCVTTNPSNYNELAVECDGSRGGVPTLKKFEFDHVFGPETTQEQVFDEVGPFVTSAMDGYHACIFAYGQTGSGKTHTMEGPSGDRGVYYRALHQLFLTAHERRGTHTYKVKVSMVEIYNETVRDLLAPKASGKGLDVRQGPKGVYIAGVTVADAPDLSRVHELMAMGGANRAKGATDANEFSSRSHSLLMITLECQNKSTGARSSGKLVLVDLAGSERLAKSHATGERLKEAKNINRSLSALGDVIAALVAKSPHVPFRNSKLTYLLKDSLGKDNKALMIVQTAPTKSSRSETICSLNFATRVGTVEQGAAKRSGDSVEVTKLRAVINKQKAHEQHLVTQLRQAQKTASRHSETAEKLSNEVRNHQQASSRLSVSLSDKEREVAMLHAEVAALKQARTSTRDEVGSVREELALRAKEAQQWKDKASKLERAVTKLTDQHTRATRQLDEERDRQRRAQHAETGLRDEVQAALSSATQWKKEALQLRGKVQDLQASLESAREATAAAVARATKQAEAGVPPADAEAPVVSILRHSTSGNPGTVAPSHSATNAAAARTGENANPAAGKTGKSSGVALSRSATVPTRRTSRKKSVTFAEPMSDDEGDDANPVVRRSATPHRSTTTRKLRSRTADSTSHTSSRRALKRSHTTSSTRTSPTRGVVDDRQRAGKRRTTTAMSTSRAMKRNRTLGAASRTTLGSASRVLTTTPRRSRRTASRRVGGNATASTASSLAKKWKF